MIHDNLGTKHYYSNTLPTHGQYLCNLLVGSGYNTPSSFINTQTAICLLRNWYISYVKGRVASSLSLMKNIYYAG